MSREASSTKPGPMTERDDLLPDRQALPSTRRLVIDRRLLVSLLWLVLLLPVSTVRAAEGHLLWARSYNSHLNWADWGTDVDVTPDGSLIVLGTVAWIPDEPGMFEGSSYYLAKYSRSGQKLWSHAWLGSEFGFAYKGHANRVAVGPGGVFYLLSSYEEGERTEYILTKLSSRLAIAWQKTTPVDAPGVRWADVATDGHGNVYLGGSIDPGGSALSKGGWIAKYDSAGNLVKQIVVPQAGVQLGTLTIDSQGAIYAIGNRWGGTSVKPNISIWLGKFTAAGTLLWSKSFGSGVGTLGKAIAVDRNGFVHAVGYYGQRSWVAKYSANGALRWSRTGPLYSEADAVLVDKLGNVSVVGQSRVSSTSDYLWLRRFTSGGTLLAERTYHYDDTRNIVYDVAVGSGTTFFMTGSAFSKTSGMDLVIKAFGP